MTVKSYCNNCLSETNHDVLHSCTRVWPGSDEEGPPFEERMLYELVQCRGCENVSLRRIYTLWGNEDEIDVFPHAVYRKIPDWLRGLDWYFGEPRATLRSLLSEIYSAMHSDNLRLAMMGTRAVIDVVLTDKLGDIGGFDKKLREAKDNGWLTAGQHDVLVRAVDAGNAAAHRAYKPNAEQLGRVLDVVEHLLQALYVLEASASAIARDTPPRPQR